MSEQLPAAAGAAAGSARSGGTWGSALSCQEFAAVGSVGFEPVGQVFGVAVYAAASAGGSSCPGTSGSAGGGMPAPRDVRAAGPGDAGFGPLVEAMYQARDAAIGRMAAQCAALGGHGVVGVRLSRGRFALGGLEFTAIGTAVRAPGAAAAPRVPFTSDVSGQDFARLIMAGWVPAGLALGIAIGSRHDDRATARQARPWSGNAEVAGWTDLVNQSRKDARRRLEADVRQLGGEGVVIAGMQMQVRERDCPAAVGRRDHIVEVTFTGTAIARFSPARHRPGGPAMAIMPLGSQHHRGSLHGVRGGGVLPCMTNTTSTAGTPEFTAAAFPVTTAFELPGKVVERNLGITFGLVVRAMGFSNTVAGGISSLRQGEVSQFTMVLEDARRHAIDRMIENAKLLGANAVIAMRFDSSEIGKARAEVVAYGSAVVVSPPAGV